MEYEVKLAAKDFSVTIPEARALTETVAKDQDHAAVNLINQRTMEYAIPFVHVDADELEAINNATESGIYPLTFIIDTNRYNDEKSIVVYVTDGKVKNRNVKLEDLLESMKRLHEKPIVREAIKMTTGLGLIAAGVALIFKKNKTR